MNIPQIVRHLLPVLAFVSSTAYLHAGNTGSNTVSADIPVVNELSVTGTAPSFTFTTPAAGATMGSTAQTNTNSVLNITTNETNKKVTVAISAVTTGVTLGVSLDAAACSSNGIAPVAITNLSTTAVDLTSNATPFGNVATGSGIPITYTITLDKTAAPHTTGHGGALVPTVTYTLTDTI